MRKLGIIAVLSLMALAIAAVPALAAKPTDTGGGSPHFIKNATFSSLDGANLVANFKETGLASGATETITLAATVDTTYECVTGGSTNPAAANKKTFRTTESTSGEFTADKNGNIVGDLTLTAPTAEELGFTCPPGQTVTLVSVKYTDVTLTDADTGISTGLANQTYTNPDAPPVKIRP